MPLSVFGPRPLLLPISPRGLRVSADLGPYLPEGDEDQIAFLCLPPFSLFLLIVLPTAMHSDSRKLLEQARATVDTVAGFGIGTTSVYSSPDYKPVAETSEEGRKQGRERNGISVIQQSHERDCSPHFLDEEAGSERFRNLLIVTQLGRGRVG